MIIFIKFHSENLYSYLSHKYMGADFEKSNYLIVKVKY